MKILLTFCHQTLVCKSSEKAYSPYISKLENIFYDNYNTNKSISGFSLNQQDETKQIIHASLTYRDSVSNYLKNFLDDLDNETAEKFDLLHTKMLNIFFINSTTIYFLTG